MVVTPAYLALALQTRCETVNGMSVEAARARIANSVARIGRQVGAAKALLGPELKLVVLPEYVLTGFPIREPTAQWAAMAAIAADGPEIAALAQVAADNGVFLALNAYELDPHFAPLHFQTCFLLAPDGTLVMRAHRLISLYTPTPVHVWDGYLDHYGLAHVLPVASTPIGMLGAIASEEVLYPEIARLLALRGAEVLLHGTGEIGSPRATPKEICRLARAVENSAYLVSANAAALVSGDVPVATTDGMSKIVDYRGLVLAEALPGETIGAHAEIDLLALRRHRIRPGMGAMLARVPAQAFADLYAVLPAFPLNGLAGSVEAVPDRSGFQAGLAEVIDRLVDQGRLRRPD